MKGVGSVSQVSKCRQRKGQCRSLVSGTRGRVDGLHHNKVFKIDCLDHVDWSRCV